MVMVTRNIASDIASLYPEVDNLSTFVHPAYQKTFSFMTNEQIVESAGTIAGKIADSSYRHIVVSETGARPFANICEKILQQEGIDFTWTYLKFPRAPTALFPVLNAYLTPQERKEIGGELQDRCGEIPASLLQPERKLLDILLRELPTSTQKSPVSNLLAPTKIGRTLSHPFLFFDEYIDSGTTLQNYDLYFQFFNPSPQFKTISYYINVKNWRQFPLILSSEYDFSSQQQCYERGAYPFENRVDLIGYFYSLDESTHQKVTLEELTSSLQSHKSANPGLWLDLLSQRIEKDNLVDLVRSKTNISAVGKYIDENQVLRYYVAAFEQQTLPANKASREFLWQLFEMYGPIWSPLPDEYHLDFLQAFDGSKEVLRGMTNWERLHELYVETRSSIITKALQVCLMRKLAWEDCIHKLIGGQK